MTTPRLLPLAGIAIVASVLLAGCAAPAADPATTPPASSGAASDAAEQPHGFVEGAEELTEAQTTIAGIAEDGSVSALNLLSGESAQLEPIGPATAASSDGRFLYAATETGTTIVDTGVWTVPHGDHVHYYATSPRTAGSLEERGPAEVAATEQHVVLSFSDSGTSILLDRLALGRGEVTELARVESAPHAAAGAPHGEGFIASTVDPSGAVALQPFDASGTPDGDAVPCADPADVHQTNLGAAFACADGLVFADAKDETSPLTKVAYPTGTAAAPVTALDNRPNRPDLAGPAGGAGSPGVWLASARAEDISFIATPRPIIEAVAVGDDQRRVVAIDDAGSVLVIDGKTGQIAGQQDGLIPAPASADGVHLSVDTSRAYLSTRDGTALLELDYRDGARVARTLALPAAPAFAFETGN